LTILPPVRFGNRTLDRAHLDLQREYVRDLIADQLRKYTSWSIHHV